MELATAPFPEPIEEFSLFLSTNSLKSSLATASSSSGLRSPLLLLLLKGRLMNEARLVIWDC